MSAQYAGWQNVLQKFFLAVYHTKIEGSASVFHHGTEEDADKSAPVHKRYTGSSCDVHHLLDLHASSPISKLRK